MRNSLSRSGALALAVACLMVLAPSPEQRMQPVAATADMVPATTAPPATTTSSTTTSSTTTSSTTTSSTTTTTTTRPPLEPPTFDSVEGINRISEFAKYTSRGLWRWERYLPEIQDIRITSTADGAEQPALWLPPQGEGDRPLLVILHSWSSNYVQHAGIPFALWAEENGWAVIAPEFRGRNDDADAIGSELAVQDAVDAIDYATAQEGVDEDRVFAVGYSGGGMMALLLAGRHPDKVTAVSAWGPVYDLVAFYQRSRWAGRHYAWEISRACGGDPRPEGDAHEECLRRSPMTYLDGAREAGVPVYIGQGLWDSILNPRQSAQAFNQLADPEDRLTDEQIEQIAGRKVPEEFADPPEFETFFGPGDPEVQFALHSADVWLVYFGSNHEMVYLAAMRWFASDPY